MIDNDDYVSRETESEKAGRLFFYDIVEKLGVPELKKNSDALKDVQGLFLLRRTRGSLETRGDTIVNSHVDEAIQSRFGTLSRIQPGILEFARNYLRSNDFLGKQLWDSGIRIQPTRFVQERSERTGDMYGNVAEWVIGFLSKHLEKDAFQNVLQTHFFSILDDTPEHAQELVEKIHSMLEDHRRWSN